MKGRKWGKLPREASCFRTSARLHHMCAHMCMRVCRNYMFVHSYVRVYVYRYASRKRYPTFRDYFHASSSPFDSHGSPHLDYKRQSLLLPLLLLQRLSHRNTRERSQQYRMKLRRVSIACTSRGNER